MSDDNYNFVCEDQLHVNRWKRTVYHFFNYQRIPINTTPRPTPYVVPTTTTRPTTTTTTTTTVPTTTQAPETNCLEMKLQKILRPSATLKMSERKCNIRVLTDNNYYPGKT